MMTMTLNYSIPDQLSQRLTLKLDEKNFVDCIHRQTGLLVSQFHKWFALNVTPQHAATCKTVQGHLQEYYMHSDVSVQTPYHH